jgi:hypothetical protein
VVYTTLQDHLIPVSALKHPVKPKVKKHLGFHALRLAMSGHCQAIEDPRQVGKCSYSQHDIMMSAFACMYFQDPSLLHFQQRLEKKYHRHNLQSLFGVSHTPQESQKQDCEYTAAKRFIERLKHAHPRLRLLLCGDWLFSRQPMIETVLANSMHCLFVAKPYDHTYLMEWLAAYDELPHYEYRDNQGRRHLYCWQNQVPLHGGGKAPLVNYLEYQMENKQGKVTYRNSWVTDISVSEQNIHTLVRGGRCRWKIENECFNTLKSQGYHIEHNYGHGKQYLSYNMYLLTLLAFYFNQIFELTDDIYQACRKSYGSKAHLWENFRVTIRIQVVDSREHLMDLLLNDDDYEVTAVKKS